MRDIPDELGSGRIGAEVATDQVRDHRRVPGDGGHRPPRPGLTGHEVELTHQPPDVLQTRVPAQARQLGVDTAVPLGAVGLGEDERDDGLQLLPAQLRVRRGPIPPLVESGLRHLQPYTCGSPDSWPSRRR